MDIVTEYNSALSQVGARTIADTSRIEARRSTSHMACTDAAPTLAHTIAPLHYDVHRIPPSPSVEATKGTFAACGKQLDS